MGTARKKGGAEADGKPGPRSLETAKEILMEVFHARPSEVEEISHEATVHGEIV